MVVTLRRVGDEWSFTVDDQLIKKLGWSADTSFKVDPTPDGRGVTLSPANDDVAVDDRAERIRRIGKGIADRHDSVLRKLAE
ncbi:hypothetical protein [Paludisphaera rhizosphaerae]|uniref:hypothetical protein n=1 Tax=Paludisphaera rhizosphaerae TaxID=2711216 RepID=UPI0013EB8AB8|nr:hypothetical protein [Paludisphaera rhizosphaerae]